MTVRVRQHVQLAPGVVAHMLQEDGARIPLGCVVHHRGGQCRVQLEWGHTADDPFQLESLVPLTISPGVTCPACGTTGAIRDGRWIEL